MKFLLSAFFTLAFLFGFGQKSGDKLTITISLTTPNTIIADAKEIIRNAAFDGGFDAWNAYLSDTSKLNDANIRNLPTGEYEMDFVFRVGKKGNIELVAATLSSDKEPVDYFSTVMRNSPGWEPARTKSGPIAQEFTQRIRLDIKNDAPTISDERAVFPGGNLQWNEFVNKNLNTTIPTMKGAKPGSYRVDIRFNVRADGRIANIQALTNNGFGMEQEALRVLHISPKWKPAVWKGNAIPSKVVESFLFEVKETSLAIDFASDSVVIDVDSPAEYSTGFLGFRNLIIEYLRDDIGSINGATVGEYPVQVAFSVDKNGNPGNIKPLTNFGYGMEEELIRVLKNTKWKPALKDGVPVPSIKTEGYVFQTPPPKGPYTRDVLFYGEYFLKFLDELKKDDRETVVLAFRELMNVKSLPVMYNTEVDKQLYQVNVPLKKGRAVVFFTTHHDIYTLTGSVIKSQEDLEKATKEALELKKTFMADVMAWKKTYGNYTVKNIAQKNEAPQYSPAIVSKATLPKDVVYKPEIQAHYPGGIMAWKKYVYNNLKLDVAAINGAAEGDFPAAIQFLVNKDGTISHVTPITRTGNGTEKELERLVKASGKWNPAKVKGQPVNTFHTLAVKFPSQNSPAAPGYSRKLADPNVRQVVYFKDHITGFISGLSTQTKMELANILNWLMVNQKITDTYFSEVGDGVYSINFTSGTDKIIVYFTTNYDIYLLNGFINSSTTIHEIELNKAKQLKAAFDKEKAPLVEQVDSRYSILDIKSPDPVPALDNETLREVKIGTIQNEVSREGVKDLGIVFPPPGGNNGKGIVEVRKPGYEPEPEIFTKVEIDAAYPGGSAAWRNFMEQNLNGEVPVKNGAPAGIFTVIIQFIVELDGSVSGITPLTRLGYGMEEEAMRVLRKSGKWRPAIQNGREVRAYRKQPVTFEVVEPRRKRKG